MIFQAYCVGLGLGFLVGFLTYKIFFSRQTED